jgi:ribose transport system permease protein
MPESLETGFALRTVANVPLPAVCALAVALGLWMTLRFLRYGRRSLAIGSSRAAAERAGIPVSRHVISLTMLCGLLAGFAGFVDLAHFSATTVQGHTNDALGAITAVVLGGTLLEGGRISVWGTVAGAALTVILTSGLVMVGVQPFWQLVAVGSVLIAAVGIDRLRTQRRP